MAIAERIKFFRNLRGMTQKWLGAAIGFPEKTADIRMAQYESGTRTPKADLTSKLASVLEVAPEALKVPDIESYIGVLHTLFALEDIYGITVDKIDGVVCLKVNNANNPRFTELYERLSAWQKENEKLQNGEITKEEYDDWRYTYPKIEVERTHKRLKERRKKNSE